MNNIQSIRFEQRRKQLNNQSAKNITTHVYQYKRKSNCVADNKKTVEKDYFPHEQI